MRLWALVMSLGVLACGVAAPSTLAAPPPTLTGEQFDTSLFTIPPVANYPSSYNCSTSFDDGVITTIVRFDASGSTPSQPGGPSSYPGTFRETGSLTLRGMPGDLAPELIAASAEFTISSSSGQVTGTKRLAAPVRVEDARVHCEEGLVYSLNAVFDLPYNATVTTPDGVFRDRGVAHLDFFDQSPGLGAPTDYSETFTSELSAPEQQHSVLFGKRVPGGSWSAMSANTKRASPFVFYFPGTVRRIHAYIDGNGATSGSQLVRAVLYRRDPRTGGPGAYVARSFEFTVPAGMSARWVPFWLAPPATLQPGVYWLGLQSAGQHGIARYAWDSVANARRFNVDVDSDGPSDPFGTSFADDQQMSIFAFGTY